MKENKYFKYVVLIVVLLIPFMYSFFYLKAYWNPYGEGNIDNLPVGIVNLDEGDKGEELINSIKDSKKLKLDVVSENDANDGLYNGDYYAVINIPKDFTSSMESASSENKKHATITYSPNQKSNYLASQIINNVVNVVEKNLDNNINSNIVKGLEDTVTSVPNELDKISDGFSKLKDGTNELENGSNELVSGTKSLNDGTNDLEKGTKSLNDGALELVEGSKSLYNGADALKEGIDNALNGSKQINNQVSNSIIEQKNSDAIDSNTLNSIIQYSKSEAESTIDNNKDAIGINAVNGIKNFYQSKINEIESSGLTKTICESGPSLNQYCPTLLSLYNLKSELDNSSSIIYQTIYSTAISVATSTASSTAEKVSSSVATKVAETAKQKTIGSLNTLNNGLTSLTQGLNSLSVGANSLVLGSNNLYGGLKTLENGISSLNTGAILLNRGAMNLNNGTIKFNSGITTLNNSVINSKKELDNKINDTKTEVKKVEKLSDYSKEPVKVETKEVDSVPSYGTAFAPLFISIALWVGCLMLFMVLYYDKNERFGILSVNDNRRVKKTLCYHGLATIMGILLGILLNLLLNFNITSVCLYYGSFILIANMFLAIMEFLIGNFNDIGKFVALIILVLQLAASGGTFPIETVSKCFRFLNPILPMTYTIKLLKESLVVIEQNLLVKNLIIVFAIFIVFFIINLITDYYKEKKEN